MDVRTQTNGRGSVFAWIRKPGFNLAFYSVLSRLPFPILNFCKKIPFPPFIFPKPLDNPQKMFYNCIK